MVVREAYASVVSEFSKTFPAPAKVAKPVDDTSYVERCVKAKKLQPESQVLFLLQGLHGIVYVHSNRKQKGGRPIFGKVYSNFLFDNYRRSFKFGGSALAIATTWQNEREAATTKAFNAVIEKLDDPDTAAVYRVKLAQTLEDSRHEMEPVFNALTAALQERRKKHYPTIDLFLREVVDVIAPVWPLHEDEDPQDALNYARELISDCFHSIAHGNTVSHNAPREAWLMDAPESWRVRRDHAAGLMFENITLKQDPFFFGEGDVLPNVEGFTAPKNVSNKRKKWVKRLLTPEMQEISHAAIREAAHQCVLAKWYFDERLQRNTAIDSDMLAGKTVDASKARDAHTEMVRRQALETLRLTIPVKDPVLATALKKQRKAMRDSIKKQESFPMFADVPWRVTRKEGLKLEKKHFAFFSSMPFWRGRHIGNCNSIAFAFLELARQAQDLQTAAPSKHLKGRGRIRAIGSRHVVRIPVPRAL